VKRLLAAVLGALGAAQARGQSGSLSPSAPTAFVMMAGKDTFSLEQYTRTGNVISGTWVVMHPPGVFVHDYRITVGGDGIPTRYVMKYSTPGAPTPPLLDSVAVSYGPDSAGLVFYRRDSTVSRRVAIHEGFPLLGQSFVGIELALMRLRRIGVDSSAIAVHPPSNPSGQATLASVRFFSRDSALVDGALVHLAADGRILGLRSGRFELRRVDSLDLAGLTDGFVKAFARRTPSPSLPGWTDQR
jgi:hypothetical protein